MFTDYYSPLFFSSLYFHLGNKKPRLLFGKQGLERLYFLPAYPGRSQFASKLRPLYETDEPVRDPSRKANRACVVSIIRTTGVASPGKVEMFVQAFIKF